MRSRLYKIHVNFRTRCDDGECVILKCTDEVSLLAMTAVRSGEQGFALVCATIRRYAEPGYWTALHLSLGDSHALRMILQEGKYDPNELSRGGHSPLHCVCVWGGPRALGQLLLCHGANANQCVTNNVKYPLMPFDLAVRAHNWPVAELLVARQALALREPNALARLRERWRARVALVWVMWWRWRVPRDVLRCVMEWV